MGRMRRLSQEERRAEHRELFESAARGELRLGEAVRRMRRVAGLTRAEFADRIAQISPGALAQIETGRGNPTLETLNKVGAAFGLEVGFIRRKVVDHDP